MSRDTNPTHDLTHEACEARKAAEDRLLYLWGNDAWFVPKDAWEKMIQEEMRRDD